MALAESVKRLCPNASFVLCLVERQVPDAAAEFPDFDAIILAKDAGWANFDSFIFRHTIVEAATAVKPRFMLHLVELYQSESKFVYLDPDVLVYSNLIELEELLDRESIVLCPHLLRPGNIDMEISSLAHGSYNLGFLAVRRSQNSLDFLNWWAERLFLFCYDDKSRGIFTDQKWVDLVPSFFDAHIFKHHGYDFATWSLLGSDLRQTQDGYLVNGDALRFIHFSGIDSGTIDKAIDWWLTDDNKSTFVALYKEYRGLLSQYGQEELGKLPWSYSTYADGSPVDNAVRIAYRNRDLWQVYPRPFDIDGARILHAAGGKEISIESSQSAELAASNGLFDRFCRSYRHIGPGATMLKALRRILRSAGVA